jgi:hypothetical protein
MSSHKESLAHKAPSEFGSSQDDEVRVAEPGPDNMSIDQRQNVKSRTGNHDQEPLALSDSSKTLTLTSIIASQTNVAPVEVDEEGSKPTRGFRFRCLLLALAVTSVLSALEGTIVSTALSTIVEDLGGAELYIWTANGYFLTR